MKKLNKNKLIDSIHKQNLIKENKNFDKANTVEVQKLKFELNNIEKEVMSSAVEVHEKRLNKFKLLEKKEEEIENVLTKLMKKIGNHRKKPLSPKKQLEIEISLNKINKIRESNS